MRILVVEDEPDLNDVVARKLESEHYTVDRCLDGRAAIDYVNCAQYDAILLDIMLPGIDGLRVLETMRSRNDKTPVLLLTARDSVEDRVTGLDRGADDYLVKPFSFDELLARARALIRRAYDHASNILAVADLTVNCDTRDVTRAGVPIPLSSKEFAVLEYLIRNEGVVLTRDRISQHIWNYDYEGGSNVIDVYIRYLRKKMDEGFPQKLIHTACAVDRDVLTAHIAAFARRGHVDAQPCAGDLVDIDGGVFRKRIHNRAARARALPHVELRGVDIPRGKRALGTRHLRLQHGCQQREAQQPRHLPDHPSFPHDLPPSAAYRHD